MTERSSDEKLSHLAQEMASGLSKFIDVLKSGEPIENHFTVTTVKMTKPRYVIRKNSLAENEFLQNDRSWGPYKTAKRFKNQQAASCYAASINEPVGVFPCSVPKAVRSKP